MCENNTNNKIYDEDDLNNTGSSNENNSPNDNHEEIVTETAKISDNETPEPFYANYNTNGFEENKVKSSSNIPVILLLIMILIMVSALAVYCIITDIQIGSIKFNQENNSDQKFALEMHDKPSDNKHIEYMTDDGRFTTEGLAEHIRPQIVEIAAYNSKYQNMIVSTGSGVIISGDGYIATNTHILDGASAKLPTGENSFKPDTFTVFTHDEKQYDAKIIGRDAKTDIAVIKIEASGLPCAEFGNSDDAVVGERVAAIGNPEGLSGSITDGIISGVNRKIKTDTTSYEMDCIQTDAAVSPGNSGGALVNMYGQVIGIISSKYANSNSEGLGFAITSNEAKPIIEELISQGYISGRVRLGITFYSTDNGAADAQFKEKYKRNMPNKLKGLWITDISKDCDVSNTDLKPGDFILSVNGRKVMNYDDLEAVIEGKKADDVLKAECARIDDDMNISYFDIEFKLMEDTSGDF